MACAPAIDWETMHPEGAAPSWVADPLKYPIGLWVLVLLISCAPGIALPLSADTAAELSVVKKWLDGGFLQGVPSSLPGITHGRSVLWLLILFNWLGISLHWLNVVYLASVAAAVVIVAAAVRRAFHAHVGWLEIAIVFALAANSTDLSQLRNMNLVPLVGALFTVALIDCIRTGRFASVALLGFVVGLGTELTISTVVVLPSVVFLVSVAGIHVEPRRWLVPVALAATVPAVLSLAVWAANVRVLITDYPLLLFSAVLGVAAAAALGRWLRPWWRQLSEPWRLGAMLAVVHGSIWTIEVVGENLLGVSDALRRGEAMTWGFRACAILFVLAIARNAAPPAIVRTLRATIAVLLISNWLPTYVRSPSVYSTLLGNPPEWSLEDMQPLALALRARGMGWNAAYAHLWTPDLSFVLGYLKFFLPAEATIALAPDDLLVLKAPATILNDGLPEGWTAVPLSGAAVALMHPFRTALDATRIAIDLEGESGVRHSSISRDASSAAADSAYHGMGVAYAESETSREVVQLRMTLPLRTDRDSEMHSFVLLRSIPDDRYDGRRAGAIELGAQLVSRAFARFAYTRWGFRAAEPWESRSCHTQERTETAILLEGEASLFVFFPSLIEFAEGDRPIIERLLPWVAEDCPDPGDEDHAC